MLDIKLFETKTDYDTYIPTDDEIIKRDFVKERIAAMQRNRVVVDREWNTYQTMIDAIFTPYPDERSSSVVPLASSIIELRVAEATKISTEFLFKAETSKYWANARAFEYAWKFDWRKNNRKRVFVRSEYIAAGFGTDIIYTWYESYSKIQSDPIVDPDTWEVTRKENTIQKEWIVTKNVDIRQFYLDNEAIEWIEDANDCAYRQWMSYDKFMNFKDAQHYKNIEFVQPKQFSNDFKTFINQEEAIKIGRFVEIWKYWNIEKDIYIEMANWIIVREHPVMNTIDWEKALPFVVRILWQKNYQIYGRWLCEALMMFNSEVNNLRELLLDWIRRSNTQVLAIGNGISFDWRWFSYDNEILTFDGKLSSENFQQISGNPPNQAIFWYLDRLYKDISVYVWIDIQNVLWQPQQTAFQTEVQRESSQKRMNVRLTNRDLAYERYANLMKDLIQTRFPKKDWNWLYPMLETEWEKLLTKSDWTTKFKKQKWTYLFECTPEILRWDIYIDVYTNTNSTTINAVDREQKLDLLNKLWAMGQWIMMAKQAWLDVESIMPIKDVLRDLASDYGLTVQDNVDNWDLQKEKSDFINQLNWMLTNTPQPWQEAMWWPEWEKLTWQPVLEPNTAAWPQQNPMNI